MPSFQIELVEHLKLNELEKARRLIENQQQPISATAEVLLLCAMVYRGLGELNEACKYSSKAFEIEKSNKSVAMVYAGDLFKTLNFSEAGQVIASLPAKDRKDPNVIYQLSKIYYQRKDYKGAVKLLENVVKKFPDFGAAHLELAHSLLMLGKWNRGWKEYEWRYRLEHTKNAFPQFKMPAWDGKKNIEHLLVIADQGYGDCIQFSRYLPLLKKQCNKVSLMRSVPLARLLDSVEGIDKSFSKWEQTPLSTAYCTLSSLPGLFDTNPNTIPDCSNIFHISDEIKEEWAQKLNTSKTLKVGITWTGRIDFEQNFLRALSLDHFQGLFELPDVEFYSLQVGPEAAQAKKYPVIDLSNDLVDFYETAAAMHAMDLIITSDTSVAHLAGALERPNLTLLGYSPDWRWGSDEENSLWYPTTKLIRQDGTYNWDSVVDHCHSLLTGFLKEKAPQEAIKTFFTHSTL